MTSTEVAEKTGLSERRVRQAAPLYATKYGRNYWWDDEAVRKLKERIGKQGKRLS